jgi:hypothetical protein
VDTTSADDRAISAGPYSRTAITEEIADYLKSPEGRAHVRNVLIGSDPGE